jgi:hypothetical protein
MRTNSNVGVALLASKQFCMAGRAAFITGDGANGEKLWGQDFGGAIVGSAIACTANGAVALAAALRTSSGQPRS